MKLKVTVHEREIDGSTGTPAGDATVVEVSSLEDLWNAMQKLADPGESKAWVEFECQLSEHSTAYMSLTVDD